MDSKDSADSLIRCYIMGFTGPDQTLVHERLELRLQALYREHVDNHQYHMHGNDEFASVPRTLRYYKIGNRVDRTDWLFCRLLACNVSAKVKPLSLIHILNCIIITA